MKDQFYYTAKIKIFKNPFVLVDKRVLLCYNIDTETKVV